MDAPWWTLDEWRGANALLIIFDEIWDLDRHGHTDEAIEKLRQVWPANGGQVFVPGWAEALLKYHLRRMIEDSRSPAMWDAVFRMSRVLLSNYNGEIAPLATPMQLVARYADNYQDAGLLHFAQMGLNFTPSEERTIQQRRFQWPRTEAFIGSRQWSMAVHRTLPPEEQRVIFTVLLCARRLVPRLPIELWLQIFEFLRRRDLWR